MASYTTNLNLKKPTTSEYYNVLDENENKDKIDAAVGRVDTKKPNITSLTSDTEILTLNNGAYQIALTSDSQYIPTRWGTLVINFSGSSYGVAIYVSTAGDVWTRHKKNNNEWHNSWTQLAVGTYGLTGIASGTYSSSQTIEAFLDTLSTTTPWMVAITSNDSSGDLVTASNQHLFYIYQMAVGNAQNRFQVAVAVSTPKMYVRTKYWWGTWSSWTAI